MEILSDGRYHLPMYCFSRHIAWEKDDKQYKNQFHILSA